MKRTGRQPSDVFRTVMSQAREQLVLDANAASSFAHKGIRGDERAAALQSFLSAHLPATFGLSKGEVIDSGDRRTGQLDLVVFDKVGCAPLMGGAENTLLPCESLYVAIEVKSLLSQDELDKCFDAAKKLRALRPFRKTFVAPPAAGAKSSNGGCRCLYIVFAFSTDLGVDDWLTKEHRRVELAGTERGHAADLVDLIVVLDRGLINPGKAAGKPVGDSALDIFLEFYLHVINFLAREHRRRPVIDWQAYAAKVQRKWVVLTKQ